MSAFGVPDEEIVDFLQNGISSAAQSDGEKGMRVLVTTHCEKWISLIVDREEDGHLQPVGWGAEGIADPFATIADAARAIEARHAVPMAGVKSVGATALTLSPTL